MRWLADAGTGGISDPLTWLVNLGVAGIVIILLVTGQLRTKAEVEHLQRENERKDKLLDAKDGQIAAMQAVITDKTLPALSRSTQVLEAIPRSETVLFAQLRRAQLEVTELTQRLEQIARGE
jgi:hypothetical protein